MDTICISFPNALGLVIIVFLLYFGRDSFIGCLCVAQILIFPILYCCCCDSMNTSDKCDCALIDFEYVITGNQYTDVCLTNHFKENCRQMVILRVVSNVIDLGPLKLAKVFSDPSILVVMYNALLRRMPEIYTKLNVVQLSNVLLGELLNNKYLLFLTMLIL